MKDETRIFCVRSLFPPCFSTAGLEGRIELETGRLALLSVMEMVMRGRREREAFVGMPKGSDPT